MNDDEIQERFATRILPSLEAKGIPSSDPLTIFLGGQPGAGKTKGQMLALALHPNDSIMPIVGDDFRRYHLDYERLMTEDPLAMPDATAYASGVWTGMAVRWADEHGVSSIIEGTWRNPATVLDEAQHARSLGRRAHAILVAVPPRLSKIATVTRFYFDMEMTGRARWTPPEAHDITVHNLPVNVPKIAGSGVFERLTVIDRHGDVLYDGDNPQDFATAWATEFTRTLSPEEQQDFETRLADLRRLAARYTPDNAEALATIDSLAAEA